MSINGIGVDSLNLFNPGSAGNDSHILTASTTDGNGCIGSDTINVVVDGCLSTSENKLYKLKVFPNPTSNIIKINGLENLKDISEIKLIDQKGLTVKNYKLNSSEFDLSKVKSGVYFIKLKHSLGTDILKISKQ